MEEESELEDQVMDTVMVHQWVVDVADNYPIKFIPVNHNSYFLKDLN